VFLCSWSSKNIFSSTPSHFRCCKSCVPVLLKLKEHF
jgi:hypothetical protein